MARETDEFIEHYLKALEEGDAALFAGAGLSMPSGFVSWKELLRDIAQDVGLDVDRETDLIAVAQYHVNHFRGRARLNRLLLDELARDAKPSKNHQLIASLPLRAVWTTNYDDLLEQAFRAAGRRPDVKVSVESLATTLPRRDVIIYKMHGDITQPQDAVLTKDDYEAYAQKRGLFTDQLKGDLISKTFLFLGFSFTDPNIDYVLSRIRSLLGQNPREHYCIMRRPQPPDDKGKEPVQYAREQALYEYERTRLTLRIDDLRRYGIKALLVDEFGEITTILQRLNRHSHRKHIFVSGSAHDYEPLGRDRLEALARALGQEIIRRGYNVVSGVGLGIGGSVVIGALETLYAQDNGNPDRRTLLRPFPQVTPQGITKDAFQTKSRRDMIANAGFTLFLSGNKLDEGTGDVRPGLGVLEEFQLTREMDRYPIPIGASGHAARQIWQEVMASLDKFFPFGGVREHFETLGKPDSTNEQLVEAVFKIIERTNSARAP